MLGDLGSALWGYATDAARWAKERAAANPMGTALGLGDLFTLGLKGYQMHQDAKLADQARQALSPGSVRGLAERMWTPNVQQQIQRRAMGWLGERGVPSGGAARAGIQDALTRNYLDFYNTALQTRGAQAGALMGSRSAGGAPQLMSPQYWMLQQILDAQDKARNPAAAAAARGAALEPNAAWGSPGNYPGEYQGWYGDASYSPRASWDALGYDTQLLAPLQAASGNAYPEMSNPGSDFWSEWYNAEPWVR